MAPQRNFIPNVTIENATIRWRNFAGKTDRFNTNGNRHFTVFLDPQQARDMEEAGWDSVKWLDPREEGDDPRPVIQVTVKYSEKARPPRILLINSVSRVDLGEKELEILDYSEFDNVDLTLRPYKWDVQGKQGVKAYLQAGYFTIREDELERKYAQSLPGANSAVSAILPDEPANADDYYSEGQY